VQATDVFVIGGGPAGLAAAIAARQRGFDVVVADGARPPIDKPCGEGLMPDGCEALAKLGISLPAEESRPFRGVRFVSGELSAQANFPGRPGIGLRRTVLHRIMVERAEAMGVHILWQTPVSGLHSQGVFLGRHSVRSRWIVGADGGQSLVRRWAGLESYRQNRDRFAFRRHYRVTPWSDHIEIYWGPGCQLYITPVAADEICVAVVSNNSRLRLDDSLRIFPEILDRLAGADATSVERGAISSTRRLRRVSESNIALVGDASGMVDCITGEGLCLSFRQAEILAGCFAGSSLEGYEKKHLALSRRPAMMARLMLALDWSVTLRRRVMRAFGADPTLFQRMLAMHLGASSPMGFAGSGLALGLGMLRVRRMITNQNKECVPLG
jgi:flavin-dependent dehydrogenase